MHDLGFVPEMLISHVERQIKPIKSWQPVAATVGLESTGVHVRSVAMISGAELIASLKSMSDAELTEVSRIIVVGRNWREQQNESSGHGLRGHQRFMAGLSSQDREQWELNCLR